MSCLFCKIATGEIPSKTLFEDDTVKAFYDIEPKAPVHFLVIPKQHIASAAEINASNSAVVSHVYEVIALLAKEQKIENGFRIICNIGENAGQTVKHLHFHVLGGRKLSTDMA